jgi:hypothetical protein
LLAYEIQRQWSKLSSKKPNYDEDDDQLEERQEEEPGENLKRQTVHLLHRSGLDTHTDLGLSLISFAFFRIRSIFVNCSCVKCPLLMSSISIFSSFNAE